MENDTNMFDYILGKFYKIIDIIDILKKIFSENPATGDITDFFIVLILLFGFCFFIYFLCLCLYSIYKTYIVKKIKKTTSSFNDSTELFVHESQREAFAGISEETRNFSEILYTYNGQLFATQDVEKVSYSLWEPRLLSSRLLPASAAFLTGLGVLGTFVGLLFGLRGLHLDGNMEQLTAEIRHVAQGASVAFETSVWGVSVSLLLTLLDKFLCWLNNRFFQKLQTLLVKIFPLFPFQEILSDMREATNKSAITLGSLAEQIGEKMQQSLASNVAEASRSISDAIKNSLTDTLKTTLIPAIDNISASSQNLADRQAHGSEDALRHLLTEFNDHVCQAGNTQKKAMQAATKEMQTAMADFAGSMQTLITSLQTEQLNLKNQQQSQIDNLNTVFSQIISQLQKHQKNISQSQNQQMKQVFDQQSSTLTGIKEAVMSQISATQSLLEQGDKLRQRIGEDTALQKEITASMSSTGNSLQSASVRLEQFSGNIQSSIDRSAQSTERALAVAQEIGRQENAVSQRLENILNGLSSSCNDLDTVTSSLSSSVKTANEGYNQLSSHYEILQQALKEHMQTMQNESKEYLDDLNKQMGSLLSEFCKKTSIQVNERMKAWDMETANFCKSITDCVTAMAEVVDTMDSQSNHQGV